MNSNFEPCGKGLKYQKRFPLSRSMFPELAKNKKGTIEKWAMPELIMQIEHEQRCLVPSDMTLKNHPRLCISEIRPDRGLGAVVRMYKHRLTLQKMQISRWLFSTVKKNNFNDRNIVCGKWIAVFPVCLTVVLYFVWGVNFSTAAPSFG